MLREDFVITEGIINYHFPFSFQAHPVVQSIRGQYVGIINSEDLYRQEVAKAVETLLHSSSNFSWAVTWLPSAGWQFSPHLWNQHRYEERINIDTLASQIPDLGADLAACISFDGFFFLSEYFRRQPFVRLRLSETHRLKSPPRAGAARAAPGLPARWCWECRRGLSRPGRPGRPRGQSRALRP